MSPSGSASDPRLILITGASRGIGAAVAVALARSGAHLLLTARSRRQLEQVDDAVTQAGGQATLMPLDLQDVEAMTSLGPALLQRFGRLDGLIANAGILGPLSPLPHIEPEAWEQVMRINVTANWHLIRILDPLLRQAPAGRAAFVTSGITQGEARAYWGAYAISKVALESMVRTYAAETRDTTLRVNLIDPGVVATRMRARAFPGEDPQTLMQPDDPRLHAAFQRAMDPACTAHGARLSV